MPQIADNPDGWGPCSVPAHLKDIPFAPFNKGDKLGRVADWSQNAYGNKYGGELQVAGSAANTRADR